MTKATGIPHDMSDKGVGYPWH